MDWRTGYFTQAKSDYAVLEKLKGAGVEYSHRLHYLQMVTEKLAKGFLAQPGDPEPPATVHRAFVRMLQWLKSQPDIRRRLGFANPTVFRRYVDSLLDVAWNIERLAPALAGLNQPNPEYP